jgi:hypothetical protein
VLLRHCYCKPIFTTPLVLLLVQLYPPILVLALILTLVLLSSIVKVVEIVRRWTAVVRVKVLHVAHR